MRLTKEQKVVLFAMTRHALAQEHYGNGPVDATYARYVATCWLQEARVLWRKVKRLWRKGKRR